MNQRVFWDDDDDSIDARFRRFHEKHPEVYEHLRTLCYQSVSYTHLTLPTKA